MRYRRLFSLLTAMPLWLSAEAINAADPPTAASNSAGSAAEQPLRVPLGTNGTANALVKKTKGARGPDEARGKNGEHYFVFQGPTTVQVLPEADAETEAWRAAESVNTAAGFKAYLEAYPKGRFALAVRIKLTALDTSQPAELPPPIPAPPSTEPDRPQPAKDPGETRQAKEREVEEAATRQRETARTAAESKQTDTALLPGKVFKDCPDCPDMVVLPEGSFEMGSNFGENNEKPVHRVSFAQAFALGRTEVTQGQWRAITGRNPGNFSGCGDVCPVEKVSWNEAQEFVRKLSQKTNKQYRLPSEAEWEYACRAGGQQIYCGSDSSDNVAWYVGNSSRKTHAVAGKQANTFGLFDMSGNVWEWVEDCWQKNYDGAPATGRAWISGECRRRVVRGGSWYSSPQNLRAAFRSWSDPDVGYFYLGFRVARTLP